jgi:hypothetical protein
MGAGSPGLPWTLKSITVGSINALDEPFDLGAEDLANVVITYTDRTTSLEGSVRVEGRTGDPDAIVVAFPANWKRWIETGMSQRGIRQSSVQTNGTYRLSSIPPGEYLAIAIPADTVRDTGDPAFIATLAERATRVTVPASGPATLALTLVRPK